MITWGDQLLMRIGAVKTEGGRAFGFVQIQLPDARQPVTHESYRFSVDKNKLKAQRGGTRFCGEDPSACLY